MTTMAKKNLTCTMLVATALTALVFTFTTSANAQGFNTGRRSEPNRPTTPSVTNHRPAQPAATPQKQTNSLSHHSVPQKQPSKFQQPQHHAVKPAPAHHQSTINAPKPVPMPTVCNDHHHSQPQVVVVGQAPKKPTLLEKIVNVFR